MKRFTCHWIFDMLVVLCDGTVVCGCADPYGERPLGNLGDQDILDIWNSDRVQSIRSGLNRGYSDFCLNCGLKRLLSPGEPIPHRPVVQRVLPRIFFEPTVLCNISCYKSVCGRESGIVKTRRTPMFALDDYKSLIDRSGPDLIRLDLFNYGDPFVHPDAVAMIEYIKMKFPQVYVYTSTNGLLLTPDKILRLVACGLDEITFSVDGTDQESYSRYRRGGNYDRVYRIMGNFVEIRDNSGSDIPVINWRYILFRWNDSRRRMNAARKAATAIGVDRLTWEITDHPADAASRRYQPGTRSWKRICQEIWDTSQIGNAIRGKRYRARIRVRERCIRSAAGQPAGIRVTVRNTGGALWHPATRHGRRFVRLGAQLHDTTGRMLERDYARASLDRPLPGGAETDLVLELPGTIRSGDYRLKLDMVCEGIDWFESAGSPVLWRDFKVGDQPD
ncbi:SPASM domain-containing protein [bacterium]|nr:SPASM domain-containing protein [candidate division CSSED10-310 bacterium]